MKTILLFFLCLIGQSLSAKTITVTNGNDAGPGSFRNALEQAQQGDVIEFSGVDEVTLFFFLAINESVTIQGNGTTLRANFSPIMKVATGATVRWERFNFNIPSTSFAQLASPRKAKVIFEACSGQWENQNISNSSNPTEGQNAVTLEEIPEEGGINYFVIVDPGFGGGGGGTVPCTAPSLPTGTLAITNSTCGANCALTIGSISLGNVSGSGGTLQFSTDNGTTWNSTLPTYNQTAQTILASVLSSTGCRSGSSQVGVTNPGTCITPDAPTGTLAITNSTCGANCALTVGSISLGSVSGSGGTLQFSTDNGTTWNSTLPTYNQTAQTILASVLSSTGCRSGSSQVGVTNPGTCPINTFYLDADGDGFGNPSVSIQACLAPENYVTNNTDCDDNRSDINPNTVWYEDRDGDGYPSNRTSTGCNLPLFSYGGIFSTTFTPGKLASELAGLTLDCDDNNPEINPKTLWFLDTDGDGYSSSIFIPSPEGSCLPPQDGRNYIFNPKGTDCNDNDPTNNPETVWVQDADGDGYYIGEPFIGCFFIFQPGYVRKTNQQPGDCDDNNPAINPGATELCDGIDNNCNAQIDEGGSTTFYRDADGDGFGDPFVTIQACSMPEGHVANNTDCDDSRSDINPNTVWYEDRDGDGYPSNRTSTGCNLPLFSYGGIFSTTFTPGKLASELAGLTLDCDDNNASVSPGTVWYKDADNDGFSDGTSQQSCFQPSGYKRVGTVATGGDCDDSDETINPNTRWYPDFDNDDYSTGNYIVQCERPENHKLQNELIAIVGDCNDNNAALNPNTLWFKDQDGDDYTNGQTIRQCSRPENYKLQSELTNLATDCNDGNSEINPSTIWYKDDDDDGYSDGTILTQCTQPQGYKLVGELTATSGDCNDNDAAINPGATEVCGNGNDDDCNLATSDVCILPDTDEDGVPDGEDCAPNEATKYRNGTFFIDIDNDGYDNGRAEICYGEEIPDGYKDTTLGSDCDDTDATITVTRTWFQDADNDGYSNGNTLTQCTRPQGYKLSYELTATTGDCNDDNSAINPDATEVCDGVDNNCNGQTDEGFPDSNNNGVADCVDPDNDLISFSLINAGTNSVIMELTDGLQISQNQVQGLSLNVRANTNPTVVGSVFITISGPVNRTITENVEPYALFGDRNGNYNGRILPVGNYILTATPYSQSKRRGTAGSTTTIRFSIVPTPAPVTGITVTPSTSSLQVGTTIQVNATVTPSNATNKAVVWSTSDQLVATVNSSGLVTAISPGEATITATTQDGNFSATSQVNVTQSAPPLTISGFTLINAGTNGAIMELTDGIQISQNQVQGLSLNIRANTNPSVVGSVFLRISGPVNRTITENVEPYALFGDRNGNYNGRILPVGNYILTATPYSQSKRRGTKGSTLTIKFSITSEAFRTNGTHSESDESENPQENADVMEKDPQARDLPRVTRMYPNPVSDIINLELSGQVEEQVEVSIFDLKGVRLFNQEFESENGKLVLDISNLGLKPGMFILMLNTNGYPHTFKFLKK
ncbi:Ig-like domain-containing protein [Aquiflexum sp. LQ15W]|uniref:MopE-related protein n=1 Tax=Cognataquiflexum nitidum TaxID=2922272 RepID=UPI001F12E1CB|nr:MopE-related protein [Cognataquiflexum nitidum]MCH6198746.1 Ig-like domain-containing protein [Cognataquiflexum nitidum]